MCDAQIGRGKTHIARRLGRYLEFFHAVPVKVLHVADYRRKLWGAMKDAEWFDQNNAEAKSVRDQCQAAAIQDMSNFFREFQNGVAIFDSINETHEKREILTTTVIRILATS